jgi:tetratricopeptide (TPR) repeat protein
LARALRTDPPRWSSNHSAPAEAQDLVLRGRYLESRGGDANQAKAIEAYTRATVLDPDYARAWGGMARALGLEAFHDYAAAPRLAPRIKAAATRAIALDPWLPDAHVALARLAWSWDLDWDTAEREWRRALEIDPNYAASQVSYALALASRRRGPEAIAAARAAIEADPLSFAAANDLGVVLYLARRFDDAVAHATKALALAPNSQPPHFLLGVALTASGCYSEGIAELEKVGAATGRPAAVLARLCNAYAHAGRRAEAAAVRAEIGRNPQSAHVHAAMAATALGESEAALRHLEQSAALRETDFLFIGADPVFDPLRGNQRFAAICGKLGLTPR